MYASAAANVDDVILKVSFPNASVGFGRPRPRAVHVGGPINPGVLVAKLHQHHFKPKQIQVLMNDDIAVTFQTVADKQFFLNLDCVSMSDSSFSHLVWVRVHFKPAELNTEVVFNRLQELGNILFHRENRILGTDILSGSLICKMRLRDQVPSFIFIGPICLAVNHEGQIPTCRKCDSAAYMARECHIKRCFNCGKLGHLNRSCPDAACCQGCGSLDHCFEQCPASWDGEEQQESSSDTETSWNWSDQVEDTQATTAAPDTEPAEEVNTGSSLITDESQSSEILPDGKPVESESLGETTSCLKRTRGADEASINTVSPGRPGRKKVQENSV